MFSVGSEAGRPSTTPSACPSPSSGPSPAGTDAAGSHKQCAGFLDRTQSIDLYRFAVNSIIATREPALIDILRRPDGPGESSPKGTVHSEGLAWLRP